MSVALFPGSFDPLHNGHLEVIERAVNVFDELVVAALRNPQKADPCFTLEERKEMIAECVAHLEHVRIVSVSTLLVNVARDVGATVIVKGLRAVSDFETELQMAQMNRSLSGIETVFIPTSSSHSFISSRLLRDVVRFGGDVSAFVPAPVDKRLRERFEGGGHVTTYDDQDEFADEESTPDADDDAASIIGHVIEIVANAKSMPLSSSVLVARDEVLELLDAALGAMPDELKRARWVLADLDALTEQRRREADALLDEVRAEASRLVSRTEIARQARTHAERLVTDAEERGRGIIHEAEDFCDQRLAQMEIVLDRLHKTVQSGRERLRPRIEPEATEESGDEVAFFDQDTE